MSNTNDISKLYHAKLENRVLADSELDAVSGGMLAAISGGLATKQTATDPGLGGSADQTAWITPVVARTQLMTQDD
jgi:hypothetical protein